MSTSNQARLTREFALLFRGRQDAWGAFPGACKRSCVSLVNYEAHLAGKVSLGIYPLLDNGTCFWGATDFDQDQPAHWHAGSEDASPALSLMESLGYFGLSQGSYLEKTKKKGWRVWCFFSHAVPAKHVRKLLSAALERAGLPTSIELFPKQDFMGKSTAENPDPVGNFVHLPYFGGGPSGQRLGRVFVDPKALAPIALDELIGQVRVFPADALSLVLENLPPERTRKGSGRSLDEMVNMLSRPLTIGERRPTLVRLAGYLCYHEISEQVALALLLPWAKENFSEPLPPAEVARHVHGIYVRYGVGRRKVLEQGRSFFAEVEL